jgi:hypothetical protein
MSESEHTPALQDSTPRETDALHHTLQDHIRGCDECRYAIDRTSPRGFAQQGRMCQEYFRIVQMFANGVEL